MMDTIYQLLTQSAEKKLLNFTDAQIEQLTPRARDSAITLLEEATLQQKNLEKFRRTEARILSGVDFKLKKKRENVFQAYHGLPIGGKFKMSAKHESLKVQRNKVYIKVTNAWARLVEGTNQFGDYKCMSPEIDVIPC